MPWESVPFRLVALLWVLLLLDGFLSWKTLASGFNPFFSLVLSLGEEENHLLCPVVPFPFALPTFDSSDSRVLDLASGAGSEEVRSGRGGKS